MPANRSIGDGETRPVLSKRRLIQCCAGKRYVRFAIEIYDHFHQDYRAYCRTLAPAGVGVNVAPFSFDTQYRPHMAVEFHE